MALPKDVQEAHIQAELALKGHSARSTWVVVGAGAAGLAAAVSGVPTLVSASMITRPTAWILIAAVPLGCSIVAWFTRYIMTLQARSEALEGVLKRHREYDALVYQAEQERAELRGQVLGLQHELNATRTVMQLMTLSRRLEKNDESE
jgi:hypothetical protein